MNRISFTILIVAVAAGAVSSPSRSSPQPSDQRVIHQPLVNAHAPTFTDYLVGEGAFPFALAAGGDGSIWFLASGGSRAVNVGRVAPSGRIVLYPALYVPFLTAACARAGGGDRTCYGSFKGVWLANSAPSLGGLLLERVSEDGSVRPVAFSGLPPLVTQIGGMTLVSPTEMWMSFSSLGLTGWQGYIGAVEPRTGAVTPYPLPQVGVMPMSLTRGPDGNVWFTASSSNTGYVGKVTPDGVVAMYPSLTGQTRAPSFRGITPGPDGNVWFVESATGTYVGRVTPGGSITYFPASDLTYGIAAGADHALWTSSGSQLIRVSLSGKMMAFPIPFKGATSYDIVRGPNRTLWFNENNFPVSRIGKLQL